MADIKIKNGAQTQVRERVDNNAVFTRQNYILLLVAMGIVLLGFILMSGTTDIFSQVKITVAPLVVLAGFAFGIYAVLKK